MAVVQQHDRAHPLVLAEGCEAPGLSGIHEGYTEQLTKDYHTFTINVSAPNVAPTFLRLSQLLQGPAFFTIEVPTHRDVEATLRKADPAPLHNDVYYRDGLSVEAAQDVFKNYQRLFVHDGNALQNEPKSIWDMVEDLKNQGLRFAERRED